MSNSIYLLGPVNSKHTLGKLVNLCRRAGGEYCAYKGDTNSYVCVYTNHYGELHATVDGAVVTTEQQRQWVKETLDEMVEMYQIQIA